MLACKQKIMKSKCIYIVGIIVLSVIAGLMISCNNANKDSTEALEVLAPVAEPQKKYGIEIEGWNIINDTVQQGDLLGTILAKYGITAQQIDKIGRMDSEDFRVTLITPDKPYAVFSDTIIDGISQAKYFVYENTKITYTKYDFTQTDTIIITQERKSVDTLELEASGKITSSLWNALVEKDYPWELAIALSQTFAWTVDFYALQPENWFKVIYSEYRVDGEYVGIGEIKAGLFYHGGAELWAIPFVQDSARNFYDTLGVNMRKTFMQAPLKFTRVSSRYSGARFHPVHKRVKSHLAVDFAAPAGTPVYAASDGTIVTRTYGKGAGYYVKIRHNSVYSTVYMHFSKFGKFKVGERVQQGDIIGYVGSTGWSTGPHLHYEVHENGVKINPLTFDPPPADPVDSADMDAFNVEKRIWIERINKISN